MNVFRWTISLLPLFLAGHVFAEENVSAMTLKQRLERVERMVSSDVLLQLAQQLDAIRNEVSLLREDIELQGFELETVKQRQRSLYLDMDRRLQNIEAGGTGSRSSNRGSSLSMPVPPPTSGISPPATSTPNDSGDTAADSDGKEQYSRAFGYLKEGQYSKSITEFESFIKAYPVSKYSDNAQYWLGEANYVSRNYDKALSEFQRLISQYPESTKISGARLKIGYTYFELKNWPAATQALNQVISLYPDSSVSKKAQDRLQRMKREGH